MKVIFLILLVLTGCSNKAHRKLKWAERLTNEAIALGATVNPDTIYKKIPVFIESTRIDSTFVTKVGDTVRIEKERLKIEFIRLKPDSFKIVGKCDTLTVYKNVPYTVTKEIKTGLSVLDVLKWVLMAVVIAVILTKLFWR